MATDDTRVLPEDSSGSDPGRAAAHETQHPTLAGRSADRDRAQDAAAAVQLGQPFGSYFIHRPLGRGGMGAVYEAEHLETGRIVALKVLAGAAASAVDRARFLREGRLAASISHPNTVYVFGTEEISGAPTISMELVQGGTLQDRVAGGGPMEPARAVDSILMAIDGLEAASERGILHRDVKPSNCFLEPGGTVKVGDFGLSTSTAARGDTQLTVAGSILGTPAFAAPEQLRGEPADVRADIYSVGATLYFLLTGRAPFEEEGMVKMVAAVLQAQPAPPSSLRTGIPRALDAVVLRCLRKDRAQRFAGYADLREALLPFGATAPTPATLGLRLLAGIIDAGIVSAAALANSLFVIGIGRQSVTVGQTILGSLPVYAATVLYYALPEGLLGASLGKAVVRLRVVGPDRGAPGLGRAMVRSCITELSVAPWLLLATLRPDLDIATMSSTNPWAYWSTLVASTVLTWCLFLTVRRANGYAALHDLVTGTRVVERSALVGRARRQTALKPVAATPTAGDRLGPYLVSRPDGGGQAVVLGYDEGLRRQVWIQMSALASPPVFPARRAMGRAGRVRWLNGRRSPTESWDAWEAPEGSALLDLLGKPQPWLRVRGWLLDLAEELEAAEADGTRPDPISLDRVWISDDDRAKLLDFPAPRDRRWEKSTAGAEPSPGLSPRGLLLAVARSALSGSHVDPGRGWVAPSVLSIRARDLLGMLAQGDLAMGGAAAALRELQQGVAEVSRARRLAHLALCGILPIAIWLSSILIITHLMKTAQSYPDIDPLKRGLKRLERLREACSAPGGSSPAGACDETAAMETYMAARFRPLLENPSAWDSPFARFTITRNQRAMAEQVIRGPTPSAEEARLAEERIKDWLREDRPGGPMELYLTFLLTLVFLLAFAAAPAILSALVFCGGGALRLLGIAVAGPDGSPASRWRCLLRAVIAWSPVLAVPLVLALVRPEGPARPLALALLGGLAVALFLAGCIVAVASPARGIQDRLAGTWLVPK